jgi:natural product precursor
MKKLGRIKLNQLSKVELEQRKMSALKGGCECYGSACICVCWDNYGYPSSNNPNSHSYYSGNNY